MVNIVNIGAVCVIDIAYTYICCFKFSAFMSHVVTIGIMIIMMLMLAVCLLLRCTYMGYRSEKWWMLLVFNQMLSPKCLENSFIGKRVDFEEELFLEFI